MRNRQCLCSFARFAYIAQSAPGVPNVSKCLQSGEPLINYESSKSSSRNYPNSFSQNAKDLPLCRRRISRSYSDRTFQPQQICGHQRMICDAVFNGIVPFALGNIHESPFRATGSSVNGSRAMAICNVG